MSSKREVYKLQDSLSSFLSINRPLIHHSKISDTNIPDTHIRDHQSALNPLCLLAPIWLLWIGPSLQSMEVTRHVLALPGPHQVQPMAQEQNLDMGCLDVSISMLVSSVLDS